MNNLKDNIKDIIKKDNSYINSDITLFSRRLENINIAIYMTTDFLSDNEPLKISLRDKGLQLMSHTMSLIVKPNYFRKEFISKINILVLEINSMLKVAYVSKLISEMNYNILVDGCNKFLDFVKKDILDNQHITLNKSFFSEEKFEKVSIRQNNKEQNLKDIKDTQKNILIKKDKNKVIKDISKNIKDRKDLIISIIKKKKEITVKDLSKVITDCSEKTLQRELVAMVNKNVLKKEGERRWSRYSLE